MSRNVVDALTALVQAAVVPGSLSSSDELRLRQRRELDSRRFKSVADGKYENRTRSEQQSNSHRQRRGDNNC